MADTVTKNAVKRVSHLVSIRVIPHMAVKRQVVATVKQKCLDMWQSLYRKDDKLIEMRLGFWNLEIII